MFSTNLLKKNNLLKKSTREGNGRDLEETDPSLLKFYVTEYYTYHLGRLVLTKPTPLGKRTLPKMKLVAPDSGKTDNGEERIYTH